MNLCLDFNNMDVSFPIPIEGFLLEASFASSPIYPYAQKYCLLYGEIGACQIIFRKEKQK